uniref:Uncharacterized protein n=1 Tax=Sphaerodactylus townsendi TaxID=933632 RepID=A0ACB8G3B4_9SAUR
MKTPDKNGDDMNSKLEKMTEMMALMHEDTKEVITKFREETKDGFDKLGNRLDKMETELTEVKKELNQLKKVEENITEMKHEIKLANNNIATLDVRTGIVKNGIEEVKNQMALLELKMKENVLRLRGCEESEDEDTRRMVVDAIAELLSLGKEEIWEAIDKVITYVHLMDKLFLTQALANIEDLHESKIYAFDQNTKKNPGPTHKPDSMAIIRTASQ